MRSARGVRRRRVAQVAARTRTGLPEHRRHVVLDRPGGQVQPGRDLGVGVAGPDQREHLLLARGQPVRPVLARGPRGIERTPSSRSRRAARARPGRAPGR